MHHRSDQIIRCCVINGWANYVYDPLRIWRGLEWLVSALTGAEPRLNGKSQRASYDHSVFLRRRKFYAGFRRP